ncbi:MAG: phosphoesterase [Pirellulales bacterium]|nr:phosphoesterase [Pirellulales bacterium]
MSETTTERVLVVPTEVFHRLGHFQGFSSDVDGYLEELLDPAHVSFRPRDEVENDPGFKQLIPYVIFRHRDESGAETVFQYTRGKGQGEGRLHSKKSVGIGGHVSADDVSDADTPTNGVFEEGMRRELEEEVEIDTPYWSSCVGMINDDETAVGSVHLGMVYLFDVERPAVEPRESEIIECSFRPVGDILKDLDGFETWSQICMKAIFGD